MASRPPRIDILFKPSFSGYETTVSVGESMHSHGSLRRKELVETVFAYVHGSKDPRTVVRMYPNYSMGPGEKFHSISARTVARIVAETISVEDMSIGELDSFLETQLRTAVSRLAPTRVIPGTANLIECVFCGRGMVISQCQTCKGRVDIIVDKFRGPCVDLVETLVSNPEAERLFVNQPWNPTPPWLSRVDLFQMLKES